MPTTNLSTSLRDRLDNASEIPLQVIIKGGSSLYGTSAAIVGTALSILTLGKVNGFNKLANYSFHSKNLIIRSAYIPLMRTLNPKFNSKIKDRDGVLTKRIATPIFKKADQSKQSTSKLRKHLLSRVAFLAGAVVSTVSRTIDLALGIFAAIASIATLGAFPKVNKFAMRHLQATKLIDDICIGLRGFVNPNQHFIRSFGNERYANLSD